MNKKKAVIIENLKLGIEIRDRLIGHLFREVAKNEIEMPDYVIKTAQLLYAGRSKFGSE